MILGFDLGGTNARALLIEAETGNIIDRDRESSAGTGPVLLETLVRMIDRMTRNLDGELERVGLGVAGLATAQGSSTTPPIFQISSSTRWVPNSPAERAST